MSRSLSRCHCFHELNRKIYPKLDFNLEFNKSLMTWNAERNVSGEQRKIKPFCSFLVFPGQLHPETSEAGSDKVSRLPTLENWGESCSEMQSNSTEVKHNNKGSVIRVSQKGLKFDCLSTWEKNKAEEIEYVWQRISLLSCALIWDYVPKISV